MKKKGKAKANGRADTADLRELPPGWLWVRLEELASPEPRSITDGPFGTNLKSEHYTEAGPRVIRLENIGHGQFIDKSAHISETHYRRLERHAVTGGDLVIAILGSPLPRACLVPASLGAAIVKADCIRFKPDAALVDHRFACWWINSKEPQKAAEEAIHGVGRPRLGMQNVKDLMVPLAPRPEQDRIVAKLDELLSDIEAGEKSLERAALLVKRYRQSVLKAAVTGDLTKDWRAKNLARLKKEKKTGADLLAEILVKRRAAWEAAELAKMIAKGKAPKDDKWKKKYVEPALPKTDDLPDLPEGWVWGSPDQLRSEEQYSAAIGPFGSNLVVGDYRDQGVPLIFVRHIRTCDFHGQSPKFVTPAKAVKLRAHAARGGDVLVTKMGDPPGDACLYPANAPDAIITADCIKWTLHAAFPSKMLAVHAINSPLGREQIRKVTKGVAQQKITLELFRSLAVPVPPADEISIVAERIDAELSNVDAAETTIRTNIRIAHALRQAILKSAFSGQLVCQDANDEPVSALLERISAARNAPKLPPPKAQANTKKPGTRGGRRKKAPESGDAQGKLL